jgi:hypothetical protein
MRLMTGLMTGVALATAAKAQPGDVNSIDIRVVRVPDQNTLELQLRPNNTWTFDDGVMNLTFAIRWESSAGGSLGMPSQDAPISSCMVATPLVLNPGTDNVLNNYDAGDGYRYRGFNAVGGQMDGSCSFPANTWVPYARVPVLGISDCATFEVVATSAHTTAYNSNWFISLGGVNITAASDVVGPGVTIGPAPATGSYGPVCSTGDPVSLNGGVPAGGTWSGTGVVDNEFYPAVGQGTYTLVYGVDGGGCIGYASTNIVVQQPPTAANAGTDQTVCASSTTLNASPVFVGTGMWSVISGSGDFADPTVRNTTVSDLSVGDNVFLWTTSNGSCPTSQDEVTITRQEATVWYADADGDGRGNAAVSQMACTQPTGYVADNTDCDDTDPGVWQTGDFYVDADSDGYTVGGLVSVCYGNTTPAGYSTTSNGTDCDDNNGAVWQSAVLHVDSDGDGYDAGTESVCFGVSIPVGYSATTNGSDCDDADPTVWHLANLYIDADGDGYDNGSATVCFGLSIPVGHSTTTNGSDCDDADPMAWQSALLYVDADGDGYDGGMENVCFGLSIPSGYISTSAGSDCNDGDANLTAQGNACDDNDATTENDVVTANCECHGTPIAPADTDGDGVPDDEDCAPNDPTAWQSASLYIDADGDGYDGGSTMVCFGASIPTGYSFTTNGTDCNDGDNTVWQSASLYIDADGDGYDGGSTVLCYGATAPAGYSLTTNGADCDDTDANLTMVGNACDDNDPATEDDVVDANCECHGTPPAPVACPGVRISQVYGGAGGTGAPYTRDFVELYNAGAEPAVLTGWSLQYASATGNFNSSGTLYAFPAGTTVAPGGYLLIAMSGSGSLPVVEDLLASSINMSATTGKVALVNTTSALGCGTTPCVLPDSRIVDLVGFGTATTAEGGAAAPAPSATLGLVRKSGGCQDTDNNAADFETVTASLMVLHNSASPTYACGLTLDIVDNACPSTEGSIMASGCGAGTVLEYALSAEGPWSETAPTYTDENITVYVRCRTIATDCSGPVISATTSPTDCSAELDCQGVPGGPALPGTPCDDGDPDTENDTWTNECECVGTPIEIVDGDGDGVPDDEDCAPADPEAWQSASLYIDADGDGYDGGSTMVCFGSSIPAGYSLTSNGADCDDTDANLTMVGNACNDSDPETENDMVDENCQCHGTPLAPAPCPGVRISQVYPGGGTASGTYTYDFVELYNAGPVPVNVGGWSLQYGSNTGNFATSAANMYVFPGGTTIQSGGHLLVQLGSAGTGGGALPVTPDLSSSNMSMGQTNGKVALVNESTALGCGGTGTPCSLPDARIVDLVSYGSANNAEGNAPVAALSASTGAVRKSGGCQDTDNNAADFETVTASLMVLHNSASPTYACGLTLDIVDNVCPSTEGTIMASGCGAGTVLEYALSAEGPWSETAPTYTDENITVYVRCRTIATDCSGPVVSATTAPTDCAVLDCQGIPGGSALPGTPCDDGDPTTGNDTWTSECECAGVPVDCAGEPGGSALPGTPCDDGNPNTGDDTWSSDCECVGLPLDCAGVPGGDAQEDLCGQCLAGGPSNPQWNACVDCHGDVPQENVLALWTFETSVPTTAGPHTAESGLYAAGAAATSVGTAGFSNPVGNGTQESFSANNWNVGDYFQFAFATTGHEQIVLSWDQTRSGTGPDSFMLQWSADGVGFSDITNYTVGDVTWSGTTANPASSHSHALPAGAADLTTVWVRMTSLVDAATTGTSRIDNVRVSGTTPAASIDDCGVCSGGLTGIEPNSSCSDCAGVPNGPGQVDDCGVCREAGPSDPDWNSSCADCAGVPNGPGEVDDCGVCLAAGPSDPTWNSSCTDCAGVVNGEAYLDGCGICVGGTTGLEPCVVDCPVPDLYLDITLPANGTLPTWQIRDVTTNAVMQQGGGGAGFAGPNQEAICLDNGNYYLTVDGATAGTSYVLRTAEAESKRFIDNLAAATGPHQVQELANTNGTIQLPVSETRLINTSCDKYWWAPNEYIVVNEDPAVAAYWTGTAAEKAATGYDIWFYDPNGTYSYVRQRRHDQADGYGNVGSTRTCHARLNSTYHGWSSANHIPDGLELNVRVRSVVNGVPGNWGPACRFTLDAALAACPPTTLIKVPGHTNYSCGVTRQFTTANSQRLFAQPVSGKNRYEFQFRPAGAGEGTAWITRTMTTYYVNLGWNASTAPPLVAGTTYEVRVRAGYNDGSSTAWCAYGELCYVTITGGMTSGGQNSAMDDASPVFGLWPNPNRGDQLHLSLSEVQAGVGTITVDLYDLSGKRAAARTLPVQDGRVNTVLDLNGDLSAGMYIVHVLAGDAVYTERLVIQP